MATDSTLGARADSVSLDLADLRLEFTSADGALLDMVRRAATFCGPPPEPRTRTSHLRTHLSLHAQVSWEPQGQGAARASSPRDPESLEAVLRAALCDALAPDGALLHAAGVVVNDRALLFLAPSGGGKSTLARLVSERLELLSDETVCVRPTPDGAGYLAYGTCFWSTAGPKQNPTRGYPLAALCFLDKGPLRCTPLARRQALRELMAQYHLRVSPEAGTESLEFGLRLLERVPAYRLKFPLDAQLDRLFENLTAEFPSGRPPVAHGRRDRAR